MNELHVILRTKVPPRTDGASAWHANVESAAAQSGAALKTEADAMDMRSAAKLRREPGVIGVAPVMPMKLIEPVKKEDTPSTTGAPAQSPAWGVTAVGAASSPLTGAGITVAVLDTGIDASHPAFAGVDLEQKDFTGEGENDTDGHGTHCAGTIFGRDVDGVRIGVARGVSKAVIGKIIGQGGGSSFDIVSAMQWAVERGANIISMSLGIDFPGYQASLQFQRGYPPEQATSMALEGYRLTVQLFERFASYIAALGRQAQPIVLVAAAGNESRLDLDPKLEIAVSPPAVADGFISVAAAGQEAGGLVVAPFSNTGATVSGPGVDIVSAKAGGGFKTMSGTSMATPHVAGVAALWAEKLQSRAQFNAARLVAQLTANADPGAFKAPFDPNAIGAGLVRAPQN